MSKSKSHTDKVESIVSALLVWFGKNARDLPWRKEPCCKDPYSVYVSEIMLQQTQVKTVIPYWTRWMARFPDVRSLAKARPQAVLKLWEGLGYYARARNAQAAAQVIVQKFGGRFPTLFDDVLALPGIGRYTAGAICSIAFNQPHPIIDGNAARVLSRIFGFRDDPREKAANARLWALATELVVAVDSAGRRDISPDSAGRSPAGDRSCSAFNQALMELGALVCAPEKPACPVCPARRWCSAYASGNVEEFPTRRQAAHSTRRRFVAFIVERANRYLVRQRPAGVVNAHFWEFPNIEVAVDMPAKGLQANARPFVMTGDAPCCRIVHTITRYRIELIAYRAELGARAANGEELGVWKSPAQIKRMPLTSAHRQIWESVFNRKEPKEREAKA